MAKRENLLGHAAVKATMVLAHLDWAEQRFEGAVERVRSELDESNRALLGRGLLATAWVPLASLIAFDKVIASLAGGPSTVVYRALGVHSAKANLSGVYSAFVANDPHRFFDRMKVLHGRFCNFGTPHYEKLRERAGQIRIEFCEEYSPVYCTSAAGYYEGALAAMVPDGRIVVREVSCQCDGDPLCTYELSW